MMVLTFSTANNRFLDRTYLVVDEANIIAVVDQLLAWVLASQVLENQNGFVTREAIVRLAKQCDGLNDKVADIDCLFCCDRER